MDLLLYVDFLLGFLTNDYFNGLWIAGICMVILGWMFKKIFAKRWVHV